MNRLGRTKRVFHPERTNTHTHKCYITIIIIIIVYYVRLYCRRRRCRRPNVFGRSSPPPPATERFAVRLVDRAALTSDTYSEHFVENSHVYLYSKRPFVVFNDNVFVLYKKLIFVMNTLIVIICLLWNAVPFL